MADIIYGKIIGQKESSNSYYEITINTGSLNSEMIGGIITVSAPITIRESISYTIVTSSFVSTIIDVINSKTAIVNPPYSAKNNLNALIENVNFAGSNYSINYETNSFFTGSGNTISSFISVVVKNLGTYSGIVKFLDIYKNPGNVFIGRYPVVPDEMIYSGNTFHNHTSNASMSYNAYLIQSASGNYNFDWEMFKESWTLTSSYAGISTYFDSDRLIDSLKIQNYNPAYEYSLLNNIDMYFKKGVEYQLFAKLINSSSAYCPNSSLRELNFYITASSNVTGAFKNTNSNGRLIHNGKIKSNTIVYLKSNVIADYDGTGSLLIIPKYGDWQISDLSFKPFTSDNYGLSEMKIVIPNPARRNESVSIDAIPIGGDGNPVSNKFKLGKQVSTGRTKYQNMTGSNAVISNSDNIIEGSLFVGKTLRTGVHISGENDAMVRSVGYEGFNNAQLNDWSGFLLYSGSVLPGSTDNYRGVGLELHAGGNSGSFRFRSDDSGSLIEIITENFYFGNDTNYISGSGGNLEIRTNNAIISGSSVNLNTENFFLGTPNTFISGSSGKIQISSSGFNLYPNGSAQFSGEITSSAGLIGGFNINSDSLSRMLNDGKFSIESINGNINIYSTGSNGFKTELSNNGIVYYAYMGTKIGTVTSVVLDREGSGYPDNTAFIGYLKPGGTEISQKNWGVTDAIFEISTEIDSVLAVRLLYGGEGITGGLYNINYGIGADNARVDIVSGDAVSWRQLGRTFSQASGSSTVADWVHQYYTQFYAITPSYATSSQRTIFGQDKVEFQNLDIEIQNAMGVGGNVKVSGKICQDNITYPNMSLLYANANSQSVDVYIKNLRFDDLYATNKRALLHTWISSASYAAVGVSTLAVSDMSAVAGGVIYPFLGSFSNSSLNTCMTDTNGDFILRLSNNTSIGNLVTDSAIWVHAELSGQLYNINVPIVYYEP